MTEDTLCVAVDVDLVFATAPRTDHALFPFFQLIRAGPFFLRAADVHCARVGLQAGYPRLDFLADLRPHGLPVLQSIHPLPLLRENHLCRLSFATFLPQCSEVCTSDFAFRLCCLCYLLLFSA